MPQPSECLALERFRDYLIILARIRIPSDLRVRIDPSDLVQDTLFGPTGTVASSGVRPKLRWPVARRILEPIDRQTPAGQTGPGCLAGSEIRSILGPPGRSPGGRPVHAEHGSARRSGDRGRETAGPALGGPGGGHRPEILRRLAGGEDLPTHGPHARCGRWPAEAWYREVAIVSNVVPGTINHEHCHREPNGS